MLRKLALGFIAAGALGIAALAPTSASAHERPHFRNHHHHGFGIHRGWHRARAHFHHRGCIRHRLVKTPWGARYRAVNVCRY